MPKNQYVAKYNTPHEVNKSNTFLVIASDLDEAKMMARQFSASIIDEPAPEGVPVLSMTREGDFDWEEELDLDDLPYVRLKFDEESQRILVLNYDTGKAIGQSTYRRLDNQMLELIDIPEEAKELEL